jgi:hypothetical protein
MGEGWGKAGPPVKGRMVLRASGIPTLCLPLFESPAPARFGGSVTARFVF